MTFSSPPGFPGCTLPKAVWHYSCQWLPVIQLQFTSLVNNITCVQILLPRWLSRYVAQVCMNGGPDQKAVDLLQCKVKTQARKIMRYILM